LIKDGYHGTIKYSLVAWDVTKNIPKATEQGAVIAWKGTKKVAGVVGDSTITACKATKDATVWGVDKTGDVLNFTGRHIATAYNVSVDKTVEATKAVGRFFRII